jgi:transposase
MNRAGCAILVSEATGTGEHPGGICPCPPPREWRTSPVQPGRRKKGICHPTDEGLGHSRGGLTTKFHLACDGKGRPLSVVITPGQWHDSTQLESVLDGIRVPRPVGRGRGRPRTRPDRVIADKGYSYPRCRRLLRERQISHTIPERRDERARRATLWARRRRLQRFNWLLVGAKGLSPDMGRAHNHQHQEMGNALCWEPVPLS